MSELGREEAKRRRISFLIKEEGRMDKFLARIVPFSPVPPPPPPSSSSIVPSAEIESASDSEEEEEEDIILDAVEVILY